MLQVEGLFKTYEDVVALDNVSFTVDRGQVVGFLGPNGAGKTTTMRAIMALTKLDSGKVTWDGRAIDPSVRQRFGYMPAERGMYPTMKVRDHLVYYANLSGRLGAAGDKAVDTWLERLSLGEKRDNTVQSLSSGNQQRVQLALALLNEPELLVLDEPFSGLDPLAADMLSEVLREQVANGAALLLSSHQLDLVAEVCTAVVIVDHGRVALRGDVAELRAQSKVRYLDVEFARPTNWAPAIEHTSTDGRRYRLAVAEDTNTEPLVRQAKENGDVLAYSFSPPDLSEVFVTALGEKK